MNYLELAHLVEQVKGGNTEAFTELYQEVWKSLYYSACRYLGDDDEAKDVVQETWIEVYKNIHHLKDNQAFVAWSNQILFRKCNIVLKKRKNTMEITMEELATELWEDRVEFLPEALLEDYEAGQRLLALINDLPQEQRAVILLRYHGQLSTQEIAESLHITPNAVRLKLSRAKASLKKAAEQLTRQGIGLYGVVGMPVLTRLFTGEAERLCTVEIQDQIWKSIQASLALGLTGAAASTSTAAAGSSAAGASTAAAGTHSALWIVAAALALGGIGTVSLWQQSKGEDRLETLPVVATEVKELPQTVPMVTEKTQETAGIRIIADMVGSENAQRLASWQAVTSERDSESFLALMQEQGFQQESVWAGLEPESGFYVLYTLEKQQKRLLVCEYHNVYTREWGVRSRLNDIDSPLPEPDSLRDWFNENG